jgi:hypothetical protein
MSWLATLMLTPLTEASVNWDLLLAVLVLSVRSLPNYRSSVTLGRNWNRPASWSCRYGNMVAVLLVWKFRERTGDQIRLGVRSLWLHWKFASITTWGAWNEGWRGCKKRLPERHRMAEEGGLRVFMSTSDLPLPLYPFQPPLELLASFWKIPI